MGKLRENPHKFLSAEWYEWTHNNVLQIHDGFMAWTKDKMIGSVLEVGCGKYRYYHQMFGGIDYIGMDKSEDAIDYCEKNYFVTGKPHFWMTGDVLELEPMEIDLVFSHAVIDHSPDPELFIRKCIESANKYVYIMAYRGFFQDINEHKIERSEDGFYYVDLSVKRIEQLLTGLLLDKKIIDWLLKRVPTGLPEGEIQDELHIIISKESAGNV